ncbi:Rhs protein [Methylocaldum marinum]|uniref:Rhs protein n=1 Tax=Methylocaldum marinum TaxID=1432792 RepID=A0A250KV13_9GAMM|nr:RHS repeat-associated core domain-containing protein [Methylocaldum marinum]BBA35498.1 Rhs protein [Methylocaldum marinum]
MPLALAYQREQARPAWLHVVTDPLGTPRELVSDDGEVVWAGQLRTWGRLDRWAVKESDTRLARRLPRGYRTAANDPYLEVELRFQNPWEDPESGLYYNYRRYYDPDTGQYLSPDPIGLRGGLRPHGYVHNPVGWVDPWGLAGCPEGVSGTSRPVSGWGGKRIDVASDFIANRKNIGRSPKAPDFYSVANQSGGRVWVSTKPISQPDFAPLVDAKNAKGSVKVLSGTHGDENGGLYPEKMFFDEDHQLWGSHPKVEVLDITKMSPSEVTTAINSPGRIVCAWCFSERSVAVLRALGHIS